MTKKKKIMIAGPCAAESKRQILECATALKKRDIDEMRASLWKPRTRPNAFEGVGKEGLSWLAEVTRLGITVGTEVLLPNQVTDFIEGINHYGGDLTKILFWLGSRNQNQFIQREVARKVHQETPRQVKLVIKNQPWDNESHWLGIVDYVVGGGIESERIILCHRGFSANGRDNPNVFRNLPDFDMAMKVKMITGLPMILDPSHIGGSVNNVFKILEQAADYDFDGLMVEVHPTPTKALTDNKQQLNFVELDRLLTLSE